MPPVCPTTAVRRPVSSDSIRPRPRCARPKRVTERKEEEEETGVKEHQQHTQTKQQKEKEHIYTNDEGGATTAKESHASSSSSRPPSPTPSGSSRRHSLDFTQTGFGMATSIGMTIAGQRTRAGASTGGPTTPAQQPSNSPIAMLYIEPHHSKAESRFCNLCKCAIKPDQSHLNSHLSGRRHLDKVRSVERIRVTLDLNNAKNDGGGPNNRPTRFHLGLAPALNLACLWKYCLIILRQEQKVRKDALSSVASGAAHASSSSTGVPAPFLPNLTQVGVTHSASKDLIELDLGREFEKLSPSRMKLKYRDEHGFLRPLFHSVDFVSAMRLLADLKQIHLVVRDWNSKVASPSIASSDSSSSLIKKAKKSVSGVNRSTNGVGNGAHTKKKSVPSNVVRSLTPISQFGTDSPISSRDSDSFRTSSESDLTEGGDVGVGRSNSIPRLWRSHSRSTVMESSGRASSRASITSQRSEATSETNCDENDDTDGDDEMEDDDDGDLVDEESGSPSYSLSSSCDSSPLLVPIGVSGASRSNSRTNTSSSSISSSSAAAEQLKLERSTIPCKFDEKNACTRNRCPFLHVNKIINKDGKGKSDATESNDIVSVDSCSVAQVVGSAPSSSTLSSASDRDSDRFDDSSSSPKTNSVCDSRSDEESEWTNVPRDTNQQPTTTTTTMAQPQTTHASNASSTAEQVHANPPAPSGGWLCNTPFAFGFPSLLTLLTPAHPTST